MINQNGRSLIATAVLVLAMAMLTSPPALSQKKAASNGVEGVPTSDYSEPNIEDSSPTLAEAAETAELSGTASVAALGPVPTEESKSLQPPSKSASCRLARLSLRAPPNPPALQGLT